MSATLADKTCTPCRGGIPPLTPQEAEQYHVQAPEWALQDETTRIERTYRFGNFAAAFAFVQKAGQLAETEAHHPDISSRLGLRNGFVGVQRRSKDCTRTTSSWRSSSIGSQPPWGEQEGRR